MSQIHLNVLFVPLCVCVCGVSSVRPSMPETTALGVAMAAGSAEGVGVWSLCPGQLPHVTSETYEPQIDLLPAKDGR